MSFLEVCTQIYCAKIMSGERLTDLDAMARATAQEAKVLIAQAEKENLFAFPIQNEIPHAE